MRFAFRNSSSPLSSIASAPMADAESSQPTTSSPVSTSKPSSVRSSVSSVNSPEAKELEETRTMLDFHKRLVDSLGKDLQKCDDELEKVRALSMEQGEQIDTQQAEIDRLYTAKTSLEGYVAKLREQVIQGKQRIAGLISAVNSLRKEDFAKGEPTVDLSAIVKNAMIEHLESENASLTQESLDHEKEVQALDSRHEQNMCKLEADHDAEFELLRDDLTTTRGIIGRLTFDLAQVTKQRERMERELASKILVETLAETAKSESQSEHLRDAIAYTEDLRKNGMEIEFHHFTTLCRLVQVQEQEIARLRAVNAQLKEKKERAESETSKSPSPTPSRRRIITFADEPPAHVQSPTPVNTTDLKAAVEPRTPSKRFKLRKRNSLSSSDLPSHAEEPSVTTPPATPTAPTTPVTSMTPMTPSKRHSFGHKLRKSFSFSKSYASVLEVEIELLREELAAAQEAAMQHQHDKEALKDEVEGLKAQLPESVEVSQEWMDAAESIASRPPSGAQAQYEESAGEILQPAVYVPGRRERAVTPEERSKAYSFLFGDIPISMPKGGIPTGMPKDG